MANDFKRGIRVYLETSDYGVGIEKMVAATQKYETEVKRLTEESNKLTAAGIKSGEAWDDNQRELKLNEKQLRKSIESEKDFRAKLEQTEKVLNNLSGSSYKELIALQKQLQKEVKEATRDTELHKTKLKQLERVNHEVAQSQQEMNSKIGAGAKGLSGFADNMSYLPGVLGYVGSSFVGLGMLIKTVLVSPLLIAITAIFGLVAGLVTLVKHSMEFSKAVSQLSAITGAVGADLDYLKEKAKQLGTQYGKSATEIVEAMKMVGSAKPELLSNVEALSQVTEGVLTLSKASGMELSETTKSLTTIMNQFGMTAGETDRAINVLAAGSKYGAVEVDYLGEAIVKVGTVAKSAGLSIETTTAAMELFGEKGLKAEIAGTGFKQILVELQSDTKNYTNGVFDLNKAIDNNQSIAGDNIALTKKFGKEYFNLAQILFQNKERFEELGKQVTGTDTAMEQMLIATDNLSGDIDKLSSSWDSFMLNLEDGQGPIANTFRSLIQWAKESVDVLGSLTKSASQKEANLIENTTKNRIDNFKKTIANQTNPTKDINAEIIAEKNLYKAKEARIEQLKNDIIWRKNLGGAWDNNNDKIQKEIDGLEKAKNRSIAYVNALGGLRSGISVKVAGSSTGGNSESEEDKKKREKEAEKSEQERLKKLEDAYKKELEVKQIAYNVDLLALMESRRRGEITDDEFNQQELNKSIQFLETKKAINLKYGKDASEIDLEISKQRLKSQQDVDAALLKVQKDLQESGIVALESANQTKQSMLQDALDKGLLTEKEYNREIKKLAVELLAAKVALAEASIKALEVADFADKYVKKDAIDKANEDLLKLKGELTKAQGDVAKDTAKEVEKNTQTVAERMEGIFGKSFSNIGNLFTSFTENINKLRKGELKNWTDWGVAIGETVQATLAVASEISDQYFEYKAAAMEADKQLELTNAGDNAAAREAINKKYAQKELDLKKKQSSADTVLKVAQAVAAGGLAIVQAFAQLGPIGGAIAAVLVGGITAFQVATIVKQNAAIQATTLDSSTQGSGSSMGSGALVATPQAAHGRWDVIGEDDGRVYRNVPYRGVARTGIVSTPTLMGEQGAEIVIDNPTTRNIIMNAPWIVGEIMRYRVPQRAGGKYDAIGTQNADAQSKNDSNTAIYAMIIEMISKNNALLEYLKNNGVDTIFVIDEFEKLMALRDKSKKKGSL